LFVIVSQNTGKFCIVRILGFWVIDKFFTPGAQLQAPKHCTLALFSSVIFQRYFPALFFTERSGRVE
jgi:hypothetical protein